MFKFILLLIVLFLAARMAVRLIRYGLLFLTGSGSSRSAGRSASSTARNAIEEADYVVLESHLKDKDRDDG